MKKLNELELNKTYYRVEISCNRNSETDSEAIFKTEIDEGAGYYFYSIIEECRLVNFEDKFLLFSNKSCYAEIFESKEHLDEASNMIYSQNERFCETKDEAIDFGLKETISYKIEEQQERINEALENINILEKSLNKLNK